ncbi:ornithine aminomutase subunit alpha [Paramaledivibacter caminithermalis]|jgi:D-ornithine 4,5-aminomutase subunit alpha|uniref:D-ornithine 4,5-aminomutase S subunit n=1 Tax=Paramaledivibacter caminithermalis (strain DSM 15212 / CIP 107654 / DViRD3) TaxID=1121301 RepID=A0A1M6JVS1_PARC5|nr:ornithine aminomutase subunit alpha [Paramaledivibacter caminithermalis]SHJ50776.1 D-ornithine 4,5-aminomutase S subunit [Paramaledivibacter caminithermalis DSM 15212]
MKGYIKREDDFNERRKHLANLSDEELKQRFWELAEKAVEPLLELARKNTTPSIERSVLLRMGFSSLEAKPLVEGAIDRGLIGKGVGHIVYRISKEKNIPLRQAGLEMIEGKHWDDAVTIFKGGEK